MLNWPLVVLIIAVLFMLIFKAQIAAFFSRTNKVSGMGITVDAQQQQSAPAEPKSDIQIEMTTARKTINALTDLVHQFAAEAADANLRVRNTEQEKEHILNAAAAAVAKMHYDSTYWWCMYLNVFLVTGTKLVIGLLALVPEGLTEGSFDKLLNTIVPDNQEQKTIITNVLERYALVEKVDGKYRITRSGKVLVHFMNNNEIDLKLLTP